MSLTNVLPGAIVQLSRRQIVEVETAAPAGPGEAYILRLQINDTLKDFSVASEAGQTAEDVANALQATLRNEQTPYGVDRDGATLVVAGPPGKAFLFEAATPNLTAEISQVSIQAKRTVLLPGQVDVDVMAPVRVITRREFWAKREDGTPRRRVTLLVREMNTGENFQVFESEVYEIVRP